MKYDSPALLPPGFQDLLPPDSDKESYLTQQITNLFKSYGYRFVKPPLMEFEGSFTASWMGRGLSEKTFRLMDPLSHSMLVLRADITPQIVRLARSRMPNSPRPLRLFYAADSVRVQGGQIRTARQFTQIGCECIGLDSIEADLEICVLALLSLKKLDLENITLDLTIPSLVPALLSKMNVDPSRYDEIKKGLRQKNINNLDMLSKDQCLVFEALLSAVGPAKHGLDKLAAMDDLPVDEKKNIERLSNLVMRLRDIIDTLGLEGITITIDPLETHGFDYHSGFGFTLFSNEIQGELGRGGRYQAVFELSNDITNDQISNDHEPACGFSLYTDNLRRLVDGKGRPNRVAVPQDLGWKEMLEYQKDGWVVVRQIGQDMQDKDLKLMGCTHKLDGQDIVEI